MKLGELLKGVQINQFRGDPDLEIEGLAYDSRRVKPGYLFVALRGHQRDGHDYIMDALRAGAVALVAERTEGFEGKAAWVSVNNPRRALSELAVGFYRRPFEGLNLIGITGTNGKTTTSYLLESILSAAGTSTGVIGTINYRYSGKNHPAPVTTPESLDLMGLLREMTDEGVTDVIMEVSSHALDQKRTEDCPFRVAVFTNLSRDHLDYHETMDAYFLAKSRLFCGLKQGEHGEKTRAVINMDDPQGARLADLTDVEVMTYGLGSGCQVRAVSVLTDRKGLKARLITPLGETTIRSPLPGEFNVYNIMAASAAALALDLPLEVVTEGIARLKTVPGRLELVENRRELQIIVDYAHTPDALSKAINALRPLVEGKLITVFGCGGDRDQGKRYEMGLAAGRDSDIVLVTSDNPRSEEPTAIMEQIEKGVQKTGLKRLDRSLGGRSGYFMEVDRRKAIGKAVSMAREKDLILIAGKGHEDYQIIGQERRSFDDRKEAALAALEGA